MRLFSGIELDDATRVLSVEVQRRLQRAAFDAKYEGPEKLHVTLAFLGNVRDDQLEAITVVMNVMARVGEAFDLTWNRLGAFPNERKPRIIFVGARNQGAEFRVLANGLREAFQRLGFEFNEDPVAHITIARVKGGSHEPLPMIDFTTHTMPVREIVLFESLPGVGTTRYEIRSRHKLPPI